MAVSGWYGHGHPSICVKAEKKFVLEIRANGWDISEVLGEGLEHRKAQLLKTQTKDWEQSFSLRADK